MKKEQRNFDYFAGFSRMSQKALAAAQMLIEIFSDFQPENIDQLMTDMHNIEHDCDLEHHVILKRLANEFVTPIEREDIINLASELDEVTDHIEDIIQRIYMYNISEIPDEAKQMSVVIGRCCEALCDSLTEFSQFKKYSESIKEKIIEVNRLEEDGDRLYANGVRHLFREKPDPVIVNAWELTYMRLEKCCDACEHVADVMESIMMKNS